MFVTADLGFSVVPNFGAIGAQLSFDVKKVAETNRFNNYFTLTTGVSGIIDMTESGGAVGYLLAGVSKARKLGFYCVNFRGGIAAFSMYGNQVVGIPYIQVSMNAYFFIFLQ